MSFLQKFLLAVRFIGFWAVVRTVLYALYRDWHNRGHKPITELHYIPGTLQEFDPTPRGGIFRFQNNVALEVHFLAPDIVRATWTPGKLPIPYALTDTVLDGSLSPLDSTGYLATRKDDEKWMFSTPSLTLTVHPDGTLEYTSPSGHLRREHPPVLNGKSWLQSFELQAEEHIYGLGERAAPLNLRGRSYRFWNTDPAGSYGPGADPLYVTIPVYIGKHENGSYLVFHENSFDGRIEFPGTPMSSLDRKELVGNEGTEGTAAARRNARVSFTGGALPTYFISGDLPHLLRRYSALTGRAPLPPRWALGFHQSRWGYLNETDIREVVKGFRERDLPLAAVHLDIDYMRGFRVFTVDERQFPDLGRLAADLERDGVKLVTIIDPGVKRDGAYDVYGEGLEIGAFCETAQFRRIPSSSDDRKELLGVEGTHRNWSSYERKELAGDEGTRRNTLPVRSLVWPGWCAHPDFTHPKTREWWGQYYARLLDQGVAGIWHDMNEPAMMGAWGELTLPRTTQHDLEGRGGDHTEAHNLYGMLMNRAGFDALGKLRPGKRPWILSRSGWAGNQRYAWNWTADTESTWPALKMTIAQVLNLGLSGYPYTGPDIGGFSGVPDPELFTRWFQTAAFMPFFRVHSAKGTARREPWVYGEEVLGICREFMKLRERLMPYLYTLAWEASQSGAPINRPLFWLEPNNPDLWAVDDVFLLGNDLLIAPVLEPDAKVKQIPLPAGRWVNFWRDDVIEESEFVESQVTLERIPVLVRGGSILPMANGDSLELHVYPDREGKARGMLYSDAGDGYGAWRVDRFEIQPKEDGLKIVQSHLGDFPIPYKKLVTKVHGMDLPVISEIEMEE
jgi:alpha-glucosidase